MEVKTLEKALREYTRKKAIIETTLERVKAYEEAINNPELIDGLFLGTGIELGMPRGKGFKPTSPIEFEVLEIENASEEIKQWIKDDKSRIYPLLIEKEQIDMAMGALNKQQKYILECKYFENMFWRDIEIQFNDKFRGQNYITTSGIRKMNTEALDMVKCILKPYYDRFKTRK